MVDVRHDLVEAEPASPRPPSQAERGADENVFELLARQARTRTSRELWATTFSAAVTAALLWWQHPTLSWLAAGFVATSAYGAWGLLDRAADARAGATLVDRGDVAMLRGLRNLTALVGAGAALWAVLDFMGAALGGWRH